MVHVVVNVKVQIWDTAGQERFRTITQSYYKGTHAIVLCYDSTNRNTFKSLPGWLKQIEQHANPDVVVALVATKADLEDSR